MFFIIFKELSVAKHFLRLESAPLRYHRYRIILHLNKMENITRETRIVESKRGKMKIRLEKPAMNISKLVGGKNEKARRGPLHEKLWLGLYFVYRKYWMEIKITEYVYVDKKLSNWSFITYVQCTAERSNLWPFIHFYYSQIMRTFSRRFSCFLIHIQSYF